ncbi:Glycoside hydrolase family 2 sugar binding protein [Candidatus Sulfopaludibacter sp. SbA3]|nr:Glycoside hydrolase family 2 sugar binding protein [Candidatus Sulfopaludibacter sp. SbA3]
MKQPKPSRRLRYAGGLVLAAALAVPILSAPVGDPLLAGFTNPPPEARMRCYWWWLNGHTTEAAITRDLEQMKAKGYGGALLVDADGSSQVGNQAVPAGPMFATPEWRVLYRHALKEADRLGLEISLNIQSGWNLGSPKTKPEQAAKLLTFSRTAVDGPVEFKQQLAAPPQKNGFYRDIAVLAYPLAHGHALHGLRQLPQKSAAMELGMSMPPTAPLLEDVAATPGEEDTHLNQVQDLSARMQPDGTLAWQVPVGSWEILRVGYTDSGARISTSSGAWQGLAIDYLDRGALEDYWHENIDPLMADARPYLGHALRYLVTDSWELGGINWTGKFAAAFRQRRGYDLLPYLPVIAGRMVESRDVSSRFLNDFRRTVGDLIVSEHYAIFAELAARSGLGIHPESGGPHGAPIDALETLGVATFPQTEFWARSNTHRTRDDERFFVKEGSSAAHTYGKTLMGAEGMTSIGPHWEESIWDDLKPTFDQAACEGLNRLIWHTFTSSPAEMGLPGQEYFAGTHMNPNITWWNQAGAFISYINRSDFLLQQGLPVSDVVYYYGDQVPNFVPLKASDPAKVLPGYDYDVTDSRVLTRRMSARDGEIRLPEGGVYKLLVLPEAPGMSLDALRAVERLVSAGAAVLGSKPRRALGIEGQEEFARIAGRVWGDCAPGKPHRLEKGTVYCGEATRAVLAARGIAPDFEYRASGPAAGNARDLVAGTPPSSTGRMDYFHRQAGDADIYFIRNTQPQPLFAEVTLRSHGKAPELWHPDTGATEAQPVFDLTSDGRTRLPLWLEPNGSIFVVLRHVAGRHVQTLSKDGVAIFPWSGAPVDPGAVAVKLSPDSLVTEAPGRYTVKTSEGRTLAVEISAAPAPATVGERWTVRFTPGWGAPASAEFDRLNSWPENADPGIRYYSGTATYTTRFFLSAEQMAQGRAPELDLGEVREIAQVKVNGRDLGIAWKKPFRVALGSAAKPGWNDLEIAVTNLWPNRLIGDQQVAPEKRLTHTNITKFRADSPLMPSGLLGPVVVRSVSEARM